MHDKFNQRIALLLILLLSWSSAFSQEVDPEEERLNDIVLKYFDSMNDSAYYKAVTDYRQYVKVHGSKKQYYTSWNNEIIYDINHDYFYQALKKTENLEKEMQKAGDTEFFPMIDYLMGVFYGSRDNNDLCKKYLMESLAQTDATTDSQDQIAIYQMLANISIFSVSDEGLMWADKALALCDEDYVLCGTLAMKAMVALTHDRPEIFKECYDRLQDIKARNKSDVLPMYNDYVDMGYHVYNGNYEKALAMTDSMQSETEKLSFKAFIYHRMGDLVKENETLKDLIDAKERRNNAISTITIQEIDRDLELTYERQQAQHAKLVTIVSISCFLLVLLLLITYFTWKHRKHLQEVKIQNRELKLARDRAEESDRMKTAFIRNVSHQVRTPLNAIAGFASVLADQMDELLKEEREDLAARIEHNTEIVTRSLNHLITLSDIESRVKTDSVDIVFCNQICHEIISEFKHKSEISVSFKTTLSDQMSITTNREILKSIISELLVNADKFTEQGSITVLSTQIVDNWSISITDTGIGIQQTDQDRIFSKFSKVDDFTEGLGLGLTFCKANALQLGGDIYLDNSYRDGARFILTLPMKS